MKYLMIAHEGHTESASNSSIIWYLETDEVISKDPDIVEKFKKDFEWAMRESGVLDQIRPPKNKRCHCPTCTCEDMEIISDSVLLAKALKEYVNGTCDSIGFMWDAIDWLESRGWSERLTTNDFDDIFRIESLENWFEGY